jgi:hypothetical protein
MLLVEVETWKAQNILHEWKLQFQNKLGNNNPEGLTAAQTHLSDQRHSPREDILPQQVQMAQHR